MLKHYQETVGGLLRLFDASIVVTAWLIAYAARFHLPLFETSKAAPDPVNYFGFAPLIAVLWIGVFTLSRVYESRRMLGRLDEVAIVTKAHGVAILLFIAITYMTEEYKYSRLVMVYFSLLSAIMLAFCRIALRTVLRHLRSRGHNLRRALAIGEGEVMQEMLQRLDLYPELGLRVVGVVTQAGPLGTHVAGKPVLGAFADLPMLLPREKVAEVLIALPPEQRHELDPLLALLKDEMVDVRLASDVHRYATLSWDIENFDGLPIVRLNDSPLIGWGALAKRVTDVVFSTLALVALSPLMCLIGVLIKLTSPGPVLYAQVRMGLDGRTFRMLKFRSMRSDAEAQTGAVWCQAVDTRRTALGTFLRKTSLDELPQLWNVLTGEMALVGPRPERPVFVDKFRSSIPHYMLRHKVKAGITGWAQVNGWRGNTSLDRRIECDLFYIRNWSYLLDLKILTMTIWKGFINKNAY